MLWSLTLATRAMFSLAAFEITFELVELERTLEALEKKKLFQETDTL